MSVVGEAVEATLSQVAGHAAVVRPTQLLEHLASQTGGLFFTDGELLRDTKNFVAPAQLPAKTEWPIEQIVGRLVTDFQQTYAVSFSTPGDGEFHRLAIRSRRASVVVRARLVYFAPRT